MSHQHCKMKRQENSLLAKKVTDIHKERERERERKRERAREREREREQKAFYKKIHFLKDANILGCRGSHHYKSSSYQTLFHCPISIRIVFFLRCIMNKSQKWHKIARKKQKRREREKESLNEIYFWGWFGSVWCGCLWYKNR